LANVFKGEKREREKGERNRKKKGGRKEMTRKNANQRENISKRSKLKTLSVLVDCGVGTGKIFLGVREEKWFSDQCVPVGTLR
jgi:hypothetical protein